MQFINNCKDNNKIRVIKIKKITFVNQITKNNYKLPRKINYAQIVKGQ